MISLNSLATAFLLINATALLLLPRRWAPLPLLVGACYMTVSLGIEIGPFHFSIIRMLVAVGLARLVVRGERLAGGVNGLDKLMLVWAIWALVSSFFHKDPSAALIFRLGLVYNACGIYFLLRVFIQSFEDVVGLCRATAILLVPVAAEMLYEKLTVHNIFSILGGIGKSPDIRMGSIRAQGPFAHSILAGTVGAVCLPLMIGLWQRHRKDAVLGTLACVVMVLACASSGPVMSALAAIVALLMWRYRYRMRFIWWLAVLGYIGLDLVMKAPAYYLMARLDVSGGSQGYHRVALMESALRHLREWWFAGTDYTRHWMATGVGWSEDHTDITNHFLNMGVLGGLPLMLLFIVILAKGFSFVGKTMQQADNLRPEFRFMIWALGASLFAHTATCLSVSFFDQSFLFIYLTLSAIGSAASTVVPSKAIKVVEADEGFSTVS